MSNWNVFLDRLIALGPDLTRAEHRLAAVLGREILGYRLTERDIGEERLRTMSLLDGRTFVRARDGLVSKGLIRYAPPAAPGRGHRGQYELLLGDDSGTSDQAGDSTERPAPERDFDSSESPADERAFGGESPAQSPAQSPAPERGRIEEGVEKNDDEGELDELLAGFGNLSHTQRSLFADALQASPAGFRACAERARRADNPPAYLTFLVKKGAHLGEFGPTNPGVSETSLDKWLGGTGQLFDEDGASEVLIARFGLSGEGHERAMRRWREHRQNAADRARGEEITRDLFDGKGPSDAAHDDQGDDHDSASDDDQSGVPES